MKKFALFAALLLSGNIPASAAPLTVPATDHPIVGKWQWTRSTNNCTEVYDYRPDGTIFAISGAEETSSRYKIAGQPDADGFYELTAELVKSNGAQDCSDSPPNTDTDPYTIYINIHKTQPTYMVCPTPGWDRCVGPFRRVRP
ncbi:MAG: hypothetical protein D4R84_01005 [Rhodocyclaceae bacterium]|nr:MAG: hypothetical protein D4R84_01005 [Rhodocyclaceae bacterium]